MAAATTGDRTREVATTIGRGTVVGLRETGYAVVGLGADLVDLAGELQRTPAAMRQVGRWSAQAGRRTGAAVATGFTHLTRRGRRAVTRWQRRRVRTAEQAAEAVRREGVPDYAQMSVAELRDHARVADIPGRSGMHKDELVAALQDWARAHAA